MRRSLALLVAVLATLAVAPAAHAGTTIGQVFTPTAQTTATVVQTGVGSGVAYTVPNDGVITSWTFQADADGATVRLKAARRNADGTYTIVGESDPQTVTSGQLQSFQTRVPVHAGDVIGTSSTAGKTVAYTGGNDDQVVLTPGDQPVGSTGSFSNVQGIRVNVTAFVEPDADGDGYGDESQDKCANDPAVQAACAGDLLLEAHAERGTVNPQNEVAFALTLTNAGPSRSVGVKLTAQLSDELTLLGTDGGSCSGGGSAPVVCTLGDIGKDDHVTVRIVARAERPGTGSVAATATATTADPDVTHNAAGASVAIQWRPGRCANLFTASARKDIKRGTAAGDLIDGLLGDDILAGLGGADCLSGGPGNDRLSGDDGNDRLDGGPGDDSLRGGSGSDVIDGGPGNDRIDGGPSPDRIDGGSGNDSVDAVDGKRDRVDCGAGRGDVAKADRGDRVSHCERVVFAKTRS